MVLFFYRTNQSQHQLFLIQRYFLVYPWLGPHRATYTSSDDKRRIHQRSLVACHNKGNQKKMPTKANRLMKIMTAISIPDRTHASGMIEDTTKLHLCHLRINFFFLRRQAKVKQQQQRETIYMKPLNWKSVTTILLLCNFPYSRLVTKTPSIRHNLFIFRPLP